MPRKNVSERNKQIAKALDGKSESPSALADKFGISYAQVFRAAQRGRELIGKESMAAKTATVPNARSGIDGAYVELGSSGLKRFGGQVQEDYLRPLQSLPQRVELFKEMADDPTAAAVLQAIKTTIRRLHWYVEPGGDNGGDKQAAEFLEQAMDDMSQSWSDTIDQIIEGIAKYGFIPAEVVYKKRQGYKKEAGSKYGDGRVGWRKWVFISPDSLAPGDAWDFDEHGGVQGINQSPPPNYNPIYIPINKAILFRMTAEKNNPEGKSLLRSMYNPYYFKKNLEECEAITAERMGIGLPIAYLGGDVGKDTANSNSDLNKMYDIVRNIRVDEQMGVVVPFAKMGHGAREGEGVLVELIASPGTAVNFHEMIQRKAQEMTMVGLAQFIHFGLSKIGTQALSGNVMDFFSLAVGSWADMIEDTINRYGVEPLFRLNYFSGITETPKIKHEAVSRESLAVLGDFLDKMVKAGLLVSGPEIMKYVREYADLPEEAEGADGGLPMADGKKVDKEIGKQGNEGDGGKKNDKTKMAKEGMGYVEKFYMERFSDVPDGIMIAFYVDQEMANEIALPGGEAASELHVTLALPGRISEMPPYLLEKLPTLVKGFSLMSSPLHGLITGPGEFAAVGDIKPVVLLVDLPGLPEFRERLIDALESNGYDVADDHGFIPHITLKYALKDENIKLDFEPMPISFDYVTLTVGNERKTYRLGMDVENNAEQFADMRGKGAPGAKSKEINAVNGYQAELEGVYAAWRDETAKLLAYADETERAGLINVRLSMLLAELQQVGHEQLPRALAMGLDGEAGHGELYALLGATMDENDSYLEESLIPAIREKLLRALRDEGVIAALGVGAGGMALSGVMDTMMGRVASYSGAWWGLHNQVVGGAAGMRPVYWKLDERAAHCDTCLQFGDKKYESFADLLRKTGGVTPARGTDCKGGCRCELIVG